MNNLRILVTGAGGDLGRCIILYLNNFNYEIYAADYNLELLCAPISVKRYYLPLATDASFIKELNKIIDANKIKIVFFGSDIEIKIAAENVKKIHTKIWLPNINSIIKMQDKYYCYQQWKKSNINVPDTIIVKSRSQLRNNVWLRPAYFVGGGGKLAKYCRNVKDANEWLNRNSGWGKFTMSEYLSGNMYGLDSLWKNGKVIEYCLKQRLRYKQEGNINQYSTSLVKTVNNREAISIGLKAIKTIDNQPDGIFSVDMRENKKGIPCVTEINPGRFMTTSMLIFKTLNYNMPLNYIRLSLNKKIVKNTRKLNKYIFFIKGSIRMLDAKDMIIANKKQIYEI